MYKKIGVLLTGISGACFGFLPIFASLAYRNGGNGVTLIFIRFFTAMVLLWMIVLFKGKPYKLGKVKIFQFLILGALGYITSTAGYFSALNYISAPLVSLLFYTNPIIVSIISYFLLKEELNINKVIALILSSLGLASIVGFSIGSIDIRGVFLAVLAAFLYSGYIIASGKLVVGVDPIVATTYVVTACAVSTLAYGLTTNSFVKINSFIILYGILMAIFSTVIAILFLFEGIKRIGASQAAIIKTIEPMVTVVMSALVLGDRMSLPQLIGGALIIIGIVVLQRPVKEKEKVSEDNSIG
ncbi:MAG: DMT family transporter [Clostridiales bacterium]|nr:DMT family transporter [Clostridiales bacterium]